MIDFSIPAELEELRQQTAHSVRNEVSPMKEEPRQDARCVPCRA